MERDWLEAMALEFPLHAAVASDDLAAVHELLNTGVVPIDSLDDQAWTPLMWAESPDLARVLLLSGADPFYSDPDAQTLSGESPVWAAARHNYVGVLGALLRAGARVDRRLTDGPRKGQLAADMAEELGHTEAAAMLRAAT